MFANAIENAAQFTRAIYTISRNFGSDKITPGAATLFFVNNEGYALTCKHVAEVLINAEKVNKNYLSYKEDLIQTYAHENADLAENIN